MKPMKTQEKTNMLTKVCLVRDNSASMGSYKNDALKDFNTNLKNLKKESSETQVVLASVVEFNEHRSYLRRHDTDTAKVTIANVPVKEIAEYKHYECEVGQTPLYDAINLGIETIKDMHSTGDVAYLMLITTDGAENASKISASSLRQTITTLQKTDKWTFAFRVPRGHKQSLIYQLGIPEGNVIEWEQTGEALRHSTIAASAGTQSYFSNRAMGLTSSKSFFTTDLSNVSINDVKQNLVDITNTIKVEPVWAKNNDNSIKKFCEEHFGEYAAGRAFYELNKPEIIQGYKKVIVKDKTTGAYYGGNQARDLLKLPAHELKVKPGDHGNFEIFVQSTSYNRKLKENTKVVWTV